MADLAVIILTYNEEIHIGRAIESVSAIAKEIIVVDSFSTDRTTQIAKERGAKVLQNEFINHSRQFQWALENAPITSTWIMRLDADEIVESDLAQEITEKLPAISEDVVGINLKRKQIFMGRWVRHGGRFPLVLLRIWRLGKGRIENRWMDEHIVVWGGRSVSFNGGFADHNLKNLSSFIDKHNNYATREAIDVLNQKIGFSPLDIDVQLSSVSPTTAIKRFIKTRIYNRVPFPISALSYFLYRYFIQLGFLDGREGLIYHVLQGFWYRFLVGAKVFELEKAIARLNNADAVKAELKRLTGLRIE